MDIENRSQPKSDRLIFSEFSVKDAAFVFELLNTESWLKYIGDRGVKTLEDAKIHILNKYMKSYEGGFGMWKLSLKTNGTPIGMCGLINRDTLEDIDIGFAFLPQFESKGYGFEAASATLDFAKKSLGLKRVVAITIKENERSIALIKKLGLKHEKQFWMEGDSEELMLFGVNF